MAMEFNDQNFQKEVLESEKPVLVDFWAPWCGPCQMLGPVIEELSDEVGDDFKVGKVNVDESSETAQKYAIMSIPTIIIFKGGKNVSQISGLQTKEFLKGELEKFK